MFAHLDDPTPSTDGWRDAVARRVRRRRRRRAGTALGVAAVVAVALAGTVVAADRRLQPQQVDVAGLPEGEAAPEVPGEPATFLLVGVDGTEPAHSDSIVLLRTDPQRGVLRLLPVPRDLWGPIAGTGAEQRINTALPGGGPARLIATIDEQLGVAVDHYVQVHVAGAVELVDLLGGVRLSVPHRLTSEATGLDLAPGCRALDGEEVLALGRARKDLYVHGADGKVLDLTGDFGRQDRQAVIAAALVQAVGRLGPEDLPRLLTQGLDHVLVDDGLGRDELLDLGRWAATAPVATLRLPVVEAMEGQAHVLRLAPGAADVVAALEEGGAAPPPPASKGLPATEATGLAPC